MEKATYISVIELTHVFNIEDGDELISVDEITEHMEKLLKTFLNADDVHVLSHKRFINDEIREDEAAC